MSGRKFDSINVLQISPDYFKTMEMPLVSGRGFTDRDNQTAPKVVVINETAARKYFPNENPLGLRFGTTAEQSNQIEIVGVLRDAKYDSVRDEIPPTMYVPHLQARPATMFHVRTAARSGDGDRRDPRGGAADRSGSAADGSSRRKPNRSTRTCSRSACSRRPTRCSARSPC